MALVEVKGYVLENKGIKSITQGETGKITVVYTTGKTVILDGVSMSKLLNALGRLRAQQLWRR